MEATERLIDVSALGPPEPLLLAVAAVAQLGEGEYLRMRHRMQPCLLYDELDRRGYAHDTRRTPSGMCEVFIWRQDDAVAAAGARACAAPLSTWTN